MQCSIMVYFCSFSFLAGLEHTNWLFNVNQLLIVAGEAVTAIENGRPVLVHCTDGWDRTTQVVALAQIMLDPYYRTVEVPCFSLFSLPYYVFFCFCFSGIPAVS